MLCTGRYFHAMLSDNSKSQFSFLYTNEIYFWTASINGWKHLLEPDSLKDIIIESWKYLSEKDLIDIFAFVIIPNHFHSVLRVNKMNGKESPQGSFLKYTAHQFKKMLEAE